MQVLVTGGKLNCTNIRIQAILILAASNINMKKLNLLPKDIIQTKKVKSSIQIL